MTKATVKPKENKEVTMYIEIGPNLKDLLTSMVQKSITCSSNPVYYKMIYEPICELLKHFIEQAKG